jgi:hypothetical protein
MKLGWVDHPDWRQECIRNAAHEMGHVFGLRHEHQRVDRKSTFSTYPHRSHSSSFRLRTLPLKREVGSLPMREPQRLLRCRRRTSQTPRSHSRTPLRRRDVFERAALETLASRRRYLLSASTTTHTTKTKTATRMAPSILTKNT